MPILYDLWQWTGELKTSLPFMLALPIVVAMAFATLVDWLERHLEGLPESTPPEPPRALQAREQCDGRSGAPGRPPAFATRQVVDRY
jgi:hypothetical protein